MAPPRLIDLPDACSDFGLVPEVLAGYATRGYDMSTNQYFSLDHHTAGARTGYWPSGNVLLYGRSDLPGPLCNASTPRAADGDFKIYLVAAGKANHAGAGLWNGGNSNYEGAGLERELVGNGSDLTPHRHDVAMRFHAAYLTYVGLSWQDVARHAEYALPAGRKIDTAGVTGAAIREYVRVLMTTGSTPPTQGEVQELMLQFVLDAFELYLGLSRATVMATKQYRTDVDWHLWRLLTGQATQESFRGSLAAMARAQNRIN